LLGGKDSAGIDIGRSSWERKPFCIRDDDPQVDLTFSSDDYGQKAGRLRVELKSCWGFAARLRADHLAERQGRQVLAGEAAAREGHAVRKGRLTRTKKKGSKQYENRCRYKSEAQLASHGFASCGSPVFAGPRAFIVTDAEMEFGPIVLWLTDSNKAKNAETSIRY
jgi:hypothetical protein